MGMWIGRNRKARVTYGFDEIALVPGRVTINPNEVDIAWLAVRQRRRDSFKERYGIGLGYMSFFVKATIGALKAFPQLNAEMQGDELILKHYYDIGIAVGAEEGLVVPVVRDADRKSFAEIEKEIADLGKRARENSPRPSSQRLHPARNQVPADAASIVLIC